MKPIIEIKNLSAGYDGRTVLHDVNLSIYERDFLGIIGPNGGGKTTLIKCILGLLKPTGGEIIFHTPEKASTKTTSTFLGYKNYEQDLILLSPARGLTAHDSSGNISPQYCTDPL